MISLDLAATAVAMAGLPADPQLDGVNLIPFLTGARTGPPHKALFWRFWNQAAVRLGRWKYLKMGSAAEYLFDLESDAHEQRNLLAEHPDLAARLRSRAADWSEGLQPQGLPSRTKAFREGSWYRYYFGWSGTD